MLNCSPPSVRVHSHSTPPGLSSNFPLSYSTSLSFSSCSFTTDGTLPSFSCSPTSIVRHHGLFHLNSKLSHKGLTVLCSKGGPLKVMISGAPASGKGTQCELIVQKFGLVHVSTGDLLRAEVSAGTEIGNKAKDYLNSGRLVPDEIVTAMVKARLSLEDAKQKGWLLDGFPRTFAQAQSLEEMKIRPDVYIMLDVPDEILIDRCVGRRLDPVTGKIYHITNFPPEDEEIKKRLITRPDDTEEKVKSRLSIYKQNVEAILNTYLDILHKVLLTF